MHCKVAVHALCVAIDRHSSCTVATESMDVQFMHCGYREHGCTVHALWLQRAWMYSSCTVATESMDVQFMHCGYREHGCTVHALCVATESMDVQFMHCGYREHMDVQFMHCGYREHMDVDCTAPGSTGSSRAWVVPSLTATQA